MENQGVEGSFSEADPLGTGPRGTADSRYAYGQRPRTMRDRRRLGQDARQAGAVGDVFDRFPFLRSVEIWAIAKSLFLRNRKHLECLFP